MFRTNLFSLNTIVFRRALNVNGTKNYCENASFQHAASAITAFFFFFFSSCKNSAGRFEMLTSGQCIDLSLQLRGAECSCNEMSSGSRSCEVQRAQVTKATMNVTHAHSFLVHIRAEFHEQVSR